MTALPHVHPIPERSGLHPANAALRRRLLDAPPSLCMERAWAYTRAHRDHHEAHPAVRAARGLELTLAEMSIRIEPEELLVGNRASRPIAPPIAPERGDFTFVFEHLFEELERGGYQISPEHRRLLFQEIIPYWRGRTIRDHKIRALAAADLSSRLRLDPVAIYRRLRAFGPSHLLRLLEPTSEATAWQRIARLPRLLLALRAGAGDNLRARGRCTDAQAHIVIGHRAVLEHGLAGLLARAQTQRVEDPEQAEFLEGVQIALRAVGAFSDRFAGLARQMADRVPDAERREQLRVIARTAARVPWHPASTFHEAVQSIWFVQNAAVISYGAGSGMTPGRLDQLLYPYFRRDVDAGRIDWPAARRLLEELLIKLNDNVIIWPGIGHTSLNHLGSDVQNVTLGGVDRAGRDATNELTFLLIEALENTQLATTASFRVAPGASDEYVERVAAIHRKTNNPAFINDATAIAALRRDGYALEDARDYCLVGCVEPSGSGDSFGATGGTKIYLPTVLDMVLHRGRTTFFGGRDGPDTGDPRDFEAFDDVMGAFTTQLDHAIEAVTRATNLRDAIWAREHPNPLVSATIDGCIDSARDMTAGGARYNFGAVGAGGLATVVDSLAAIREHVFERRTVSMDALIRALDCDFRGYDGLRQMLGAVTHFGNDNDRTDAIAVQVVHHFCREVSRHRTITGGHYKSSFISYGLNVYEGALEPASADGRRAGEPISNSMSPANGRERRGPTAALMSLAKIDQTEIGFGNSVNLRLPLEMVRSDVGLSAIARLVRGYFSCGGFHLQLNAVDTETLRRAQRLPDEYADLIVRVSGYSAYFTRLGRAIQDDIIARSELAP